MLSLVHLRYKLDPGLSFDDNFNATYKKASDRLRILSKTREYLTTTAAVCTNISNDDCAYTNI